MGDKIHIYIIIIIDHHQTTHLIGPPKPNLFSSNFIPHLANKYSITKLGLSLLDLMLKYSFIYLTL